MVSDRGLGFRVWMYLCLEAPSMHTRRFQVQRHFGLEDL